MPVVKTLRTIEWSDNWSVIFFQSVLDSGSRALPAKGINNSANRSNFGIWVFFFIKILFIRFKNNNDKKVGYGQFILFYGG